MSITPSQIRAVINITSAGDLAENVIQAAIDRAEAYIADLATRSSAPQAIVDTAKLNYAAYLAYQSYSDRVVQQLSGSFDAKGGWNPAAAIILRDTRDKLDGLKKVADEFIDYLQYSFPKSEISAVTPMADAETYPEQFKMSTFRSDW